MYPEIYIDYAIRLLEAARRKKAKARKRRKLLESDVGIFDKIKNFFKNVWEKIKSFFRMVKEKIVSFWNRITGKTEAELRKKLKETEERLEKVQNLSQEQAKTILNLAEEKAKVEAEKSELAKSYEVYKQQKEEEIEGYKQRIIKQSEEIDRLQKELGDTRKELSDREAQVAEVYGKVDGFLNKVKKGLGYVKKMFGFVDKKLTKCENQRECMVAKSVLLQADQELSKLFSDESLADLKKVLAKSQLIYEGIFDTIKSGLKSGLMFFGKMFISFLKIAALIFILFLIVDLALFFAKKAGFNIGGVGEKLKNVSLLNPSSFEELFKHALDRITDAATIAIFVQLVSVAVIVVVKVYKVFVKKEE